MRSVLTCDIGGTKLAAAVVAADGSVRGRRVIDTQPAEARSDHPPGSGAGATVRQEEGATPPLTAVGVSTKGVTREDGVLIAGMPGWSQLRIPALLRERFPDMAVSIMNDVKAATMAEMTWGALRGISHGLYLNLGTGIAAGIVVGGEIVEGAHGAAGEIGYILPDREALGGDRTGVTRPEDVPAPLEEPRWRPGGAGAHQTGARTGARHERLSQQERRRRPSGRPARRLFSELALWTVNVAIVLDPERVVIGGGFLRSPSDLCSRARQAFARAAVFCPEVEPAHFGADSALVGAGALALRADAASPHVLSCPSKRRATT